MSSKRKRINKVFKFNFYDTSKEVYPQQIDGVSLLSSVPTLHSASATLTFAIYIYILFVKNEFHNHHPGLKSFYLVPLYITVGVFPILIVSAFIYNIWEKKVAGYPNTHTIHHM